MGLRSINTTNLYPTSNSASVGPTSNHASKATLDTKGYSSSISALSPLEKISGFNLALTASAAIVSAFTLTYFVTSSMQGSGPELRPATPNITQNLSLPETPILPDLNQTFGPCEYYLPKPSYPTWNASNDMCPLALVSLVTADIPPAQVLKPIVNTSEPLVNVSKTLVNISNNVSSLNPLYLFFSSSCPSTNKKTSPLLPLSTTSPSLSPVNELLEKTVFSIKRNLDAIDRPFESDIERIIRDLFRSPTHYSIWHHNTGYTAYVVSLLAKLQEPQVCKQLQVFISSTTDDIPPLEKPTFKELFTNYISQSGPFRQETKAVLEEASQNCQTDLLQ